MSGLKRTALITGCSDGGLGAALAIAFHKAGLHVYATSRNTSKMKDLAALDIEILELDVQSESSIAACVSKLPSLDILVNNAGAQYIMPVADISISNAKRTFDLNVWSHIAVTQAFLPLLLKSSSGMIVNQTSTASVTTIPYQAVYNASKAAMAMFSDNMRVELQAFNIRVVDLKTGLVQSNFIKNGRETWQPSLPKGSIYEPARDSVEKILRQDEFDSGGAAMQPWANAVVNDLLKASPPFVIWRGDHALFMRIAAILPFRLMDMVFRRMLGMDALERALRA